MGIRQALGGATRALPRPVCAVVRHWNEFLAFVCDLISKQLLLDPHYGGSLPHLLSSIAAASHGVPSRSNKDTSVPRDRKRKFFMCKFITQGVTCLDGTNCAFAHAQNELVSYKAKLCKKYVANGSCAYADNCLFAHGDDDLTKHEKEVVVSVPAARKNTLLLGSGPKFVKTLVRETGALIDVDGDHLKVVIKGSEEAVTAAKSEIDFYFKETPLLAKPPGLELGDVGP